MKESQSLADARALSRVATIMMMFIFLLPRNGATPDAYIHAHVHVYVVVVVVVIVPPGGASSHESGLRITDFDERLQPPN